MAGCVTGQGFNSASGSFAAPVNSESGTATLIFTNDDAGQVDIVNAVFSFDEIPTAAPEPGSLLLLGTGFLGALGVVRRRILR